MLKRLELSFTDVFPRTNTHARR